MSKPFQALLVPLLAMASTSAHARTIYFGASPEPVPVGHGAETLLRFDTVVKTISNVSQFTIKPASADAPDYSMLTVEPRTPDAKADVTFILADGTTARLRFVTVRATDKVKADTLYDFKSQKELLERPGDDASNRVVGKLDLITAMIRGDKVIGFETKDVGKSVETGLKGIDAELVRIYSSADFRGYVFRLKNVGKRTRYRVDIRKLRFGAPDQALLSHVDHDTLEPGGGPESEATLSIVAKAGSVYKDVVLPVRPVQDTKKQ